MKTGASKARREARKQATAAYYKALKETRRMQEVGSIKSNLAREIDDALGGNLDQRTKRKARQADRIARDINNAERGESGNKLNAKIGRFNERYDILQRQLKGERVTRYTIEKEPTPVIGGIINIGQKDYNATTFFNDKESAQNALNEKGQSKQPFGAATMQQMLHRASTGRTNPYTIKGQTAGRIDGSYRNMEAHKETFDELQQYANNVNNSQSSGLRRRYGELATQIRAGASRSANNVPQNTGLLSAELASSKPIQEVIS